MIKYRSDDNKQMATIWDLIMLVIFGTAALLVWLKEIRGKSTSEDAPTEADSKA